ncbi:2-dehydro-3-deoxygalactonokinase [Histidinibacterium lentulum]|uniref:2-dehydro-3-deoxygalactonokinase n=1 Tax=Histidinibacterium lentulum TaxID=2480588 RepID=A0A3N2R151_9RHOB|nr:2-dehydro-3-deoxygalactonokinase [Histidinibacterium lentulum]ROU01195.1 2-dehydro-3-deoxygalactonokinase [Histidinibacterium lentulum]
MSAVPSHDWIACDWGTSNLRVWAMSGGTPVAEAGSDRGMGSLAPDEFPAALDELLSPWGTTAPVIACGMVGARQGWTEAPYVAVPCPPLAPTLTAAPGPRRVLLIPGISQSSPPDVMRGEETQVAGFLALNPGWDGVLCLPGTHTKWVHLSAGEIVSFRTAMTGELFALLSRASVLRHAMAETGASDAFDAAVSETLSRPERLASELFSIRAGHLLEGRSDGRDRLSGLLIGAELAAMRPYWLGQAVAVVGAGAPGRAYVRALTTVCAQVTEARAEAVTLAGLTAAWRTWKMTQDA